MNEFHKKQHGFLRIILNFSFLALLCFTGSPSGAVELVDRAKEAGFAPHKALYKIALVSTRSGSQVINISGQMLYDWKPVCDAWISNHRFNLFYEYADSPPMRVASDFSTFETFDGKSMNFTSQRKRDGRLFEELRGSAHRKEDGSGEAVYTRPKDLVFDLPENTFFPMEHTLEVLSKIKEDKKFFNAVIFDGSDEDGPVEINSFIGNKVNAMASLQASSDLDATLVNTPAWRVRLAFFPLDDSSETSDYEMALTFHENGVISDMIIEYDDFTISQKLVALEALEDSCDGEPVEGDLYIFIFRGGG